MAQIEVMSLVHDATHMMVLTSMGAAVEGSIDVLPKALEYVNEPDVCWNRWVFERWEMVHTITTRSH
jgi:hypothetical protein